MLHFAVGSENATVRGHFFDLARAQAKVRDGRGAGNGFAHRGGSAIDHVTRETGVEADTAHAVMVEKFFGGKVAARRVVLVQHVHGHAGRIGAGRFGQSPAKHVLAAVGDTDPIQRANHDRFLRAHQHDALASERCLHAFGGIVCQRTADRRRGVAGEHAHSQRLGGQCVGAEQYGQ